MLEAYGSFRTEFKVDSEARVSLGSDFEVLKWLMRTPNTSSKFHRRYQVCHASWQILVSLSGAVPQEDFKVRSGARVSLIDNT